MAGVSLRRSGWGLEVVDDSADGLDVGVLGLPLVVAAVVASLHDVHATTEVGLFVHHPAVGKHKCTHTGTDWAQKLQSIFT